MIDVTEILMDPDFIPSKPFIVHRTTSRWIKGRIEPEKTEDLPFSFPVHPSTEKELKQLPEGDRKGEVMTFFCVLPARFHLSEPDEQEGDDVVVHDFIHYKGNVYKIIKIKDWASHGWMRGYGVLTGPIGKE